MTNGVAPGRVVWTSVFADGPGGGNPCPVVFDAADWSGEQMQTLARQFGVETVFVLPADGSGDVRLRYFVPHHEMEMCVHATVAATVLLARTGQLQRNPALIETSLGIREVIWNTDTSTAVVEQSPPKFGQRTSRDSYALVLAALRIPHEAIGSVGPICSVSTARPKLMVPVRDERTLDAIDPDHALLWAVCDQLGVTGFYPFAATDTHADVAARQFPNRVGYNEDPATGVAACALAAYLVTYERTARPAGWNSWQIAQGRALGRPSLITAEVFLSGSGEISATRVGGSTRESADIEHGGL